MTYSAPINFDLVRCPRCHSIVHADDLAAHEEWHADGQGLTPEDKAELKEAIDQITTEALRKVAENTTQTQPRWAVPVVLVDRDKCYHPDTE